MSETLGFPRMHWKFDQMTVNLPICLFVHTGKRRQKLEIHVLIGLLFQKRIRLRCSPYSQLIFFKFFTVFFLLQSKPNCFAFPHGKILHHFILSLPLIKFRLLKYSRIHHFISLYKKSCRSSLRNQKKIDLLNFFSPTHLVLAKVLFTACGRCFRASLTYADIFVPLPSHIKFIVNLSSLSSRFF